MLHAMIMAGGGGTRFWPRSRQKKPKQFLSLVGDRTLLQQTLERIEAMVEPQRTWILTAAAHEEECARQLPELPRDNIVGEPMGRDTAGCIALAAALIARTDPDATMAVLAADHVIEPAQLFRRTLQVAAQMADEHPTSLITLGVPPTFPATGYGYIHRGEELGVRQSTSVFHVRSFREKPDFETAQQMLASGEYLWNAGIFVWKVRTILDAMKANQPQIHDGAQRIADAWNQPNRLEVLRREYEAMPKISIDYAVMEKAPSVLAVKAPYRWDDVGSWLALERMQPQDADGNTIQALHCGIDTQRCVIVGDPEKLLATVGVKDLLIIQDGDALLVADRSQEGAIKNLVELLKKRSLEKYL